jgi:hypothetical protein
MEPVVWSRRGRRCSGCRMGAMAPSEESQRDGGLRPPDSSWRRDGRDRAQVE